MTYFIIWYIIGIVSVSGIYAGEWYHENSAITIKDIFILITFAIGGLFMTFFFIYFVFTTYKILDIVVIDSRKK